MTVIIDPPLQSAHIRLVAKWIEAQRSAEHNAQVHTDLRLLTVHVHFIHYCGGASTRIGRRLASYAFVWNNILGGMNVQMLQCGNFTSDSFCSFIVDAACTTPHTLLLLCVKHHIKAWFIWPEWHKQAAMMGIILTNTDPLKLHDITQTHTHPPLAPTYYNHWTHQRISQLALHCGGQGTYVFGANIIGRRQTIQWMVECTKCLSCSMI